MEGTVLFRQFANLIENSPAFRINGASIAESLHEFSQKIFEAGTAFEDMYREGDMMFWVLESRIKLILDKLNPGLLGQIFLGDYASYVSERLDEIKTQICSFEEILKTTMDSIKDAEKRRRFAEKILIKGKREAASFIGSSWKFMLMGILPFLESNSKSSPDYEEATKLLGQSEEILNMLNRTANGLHEINRLLSSYRSSLMNVKAVVKDKTSINKEGVEKLERLLCYVKKYHAGFIKKSEQMTIDNTFY
ncbi:647_t:CDS:1 [Acaulospora colombiana]|uniref:647_t:CDS:1 n=1 Tax=Acaulospora colombiana TaxID=27376 RepID=A0ACA9M2B9_9GLOM|nr:647_t:CDS:1 [Acaulospora colombiana]